MRPNLNLAPGFPNCKIKPVDPAFRSVSTPRCTKDLPVAGPVYREASLGWADGGLSASKRSSESPGIRLQGAPHRRAWNRPIGALACCRTRAEPRLRSLLPEVA
jgi:hypothetical protein